MNKYMLANARKIHRTRESVSLGTLAWADEVVAQYGPGEEAQPVEGCTRCTCGAKYWDGDTCHSCGEKWDGIDHTLSPQPDQWAGDCTALFAQLPGVQAFLSKRAS